MDLNKVYFEAKNKAEARVIVGLLGKYNSRMFAGSHSNSPYYIKEGELRCNRDGFCNRTKATTEDLFKFAMNGFKNPWEVAPEGYRIVTDEERREFDITSDANPMVFWEDESGWRDTNADGNIAKSNIPHVAVPIDYEFKKEVVKMTVAEIAEKLGYDVEIVK